MSTCSGEVIGICRKRKRQVEFIELLEEIDRRTPTEITLIHMVCDNVITHKGKLTRSWLARHPSFHMHFTPVHCSWMNQIEQWFSILQRRRLAVANFVDLANLGERITVFIVEWNAAAHPFRWLCASSAKILAKVDAAIAANTTPEAPAKVARLKVRWLLGHPLAWSCTEPVPAAPPAAVPPTRLEVCSACSTWPHQHPETPARAA